MMSLVFLATGIAIGAVLSYLIIKSQVAKNYVPKPDFDAAQKTMTELRIENAGRLSKQEIAAGYVSKQLYDNVCTSLENSQGSVEEFAATVKDQQQTIIRLTAEANEKLSKAEVEKNYVARGSFEIINRKLSTAEADLDDKERKLLELSNELTELQQKEAHLNDKLNTFKNELENLHTTMRDQFK